MNVQHPIEERVPESVIGEVLWRRRDEVSLERCRVTRVVDSYALTGTILTTAGGEPFQVHYLVRCGLDWTTRAVHVHTLRRSGHLSLHLSRNESGEWLRDGEVLPELEGLLDIDLQITPSTNTLPIRRLALPMAGRARVDALWIRFPDLSLEPLAQHYQRVADRRYLYESGGGSFQAELEVDDEGLVVRYGNLWERVSP